MLESGLLDVAQKDPTQAGKAVVVGEDGMLELGEAGGAVYLDGSALVIPEQPAPAPEPVATIDGVDYYHKCEFDLESLSTGSQFRNYDLLTKNKTSAEPYLSVYPRDVTTCVLAIGSHGLQIFSWMIFGSAVDYTSRAFTVVDTQEEATDNTKICLPTCTAYYGFLSEDGKTFISYYNLKIEPGQSVPEYVNSVKQGNAVIPLADDRLPEASTSDEGKTLSIDENGNYQLVTASGGGTQLYYHYIVIPCSWTYEEQNCCSKCRIRSYIKFVRKSKYIRKHVFIVGAMNNGSISSGSSKIFVYCGKAISLTSGFETSVNSYTPSAAFNQFRRSVFEANYPGASLSAYTYNADSINLSTGKMNIRVNLISNFSADMANSTDTVTAL